MNVRLRSFWFRNPFDFIYIECGFVVFIQFIFTSEFNLLIVIVLVEKKKIDSLAIDWFTYASVIESLFSWLQTNASPVKKKKKNGIQCSGTSHLFFWACDCLCMSCHCSKHASLASLLELTFRMHLFVICVDCAQPNEIFLFILPLITINILHFFFSGNKLSPSVRRMASHSIIENGHNENVCSARREHTWKNKYEYEYECARTSGKRARSNEEVELHE